MEPVVAALATLPYVGRHCVPAAYRPLFEAGSPLKDLFPDPCLVCHEFRKQNRTLSDKMKGLQAELATIQGVLRQTPQGNRGG